ncbi:uncharacterized protein LOC112521302 [Cynara cardunculus var. scolymus]|uniref:Uncharacterized protein n=1 Tax=Cynara cardunculus var. scolymus TaxID=59895 RepID=A0A118JU31_CYNCS|nr:uncharacterized protein LOC112521302 [Cynara cardunculus var. scolymus]KVH90582.1 hypothetical protein Ccrd_007459 [Cynara cardunculus var. scolymus]
MSSYTNTPNLDHLLLQTLMGRLQIRPPNPLQPQLSPSFNKTLEDLLMDTINNISDAEDDQDDDDDDDENNRRSKTRLAKEESKLEKEVIKIILSGNTEEALKPNSGQAVTIGEHHICVGYHMEAGSEYRVWEWHGHIMLFDDENGYDPEYIYGNYFERLRVVPEKMKEEEAVMKEEEKPMNSGLKDLIGSSEDGGSGRILHRNMNTGSSRV